MESFIKDKTKISNLSLKLSKQEITPEVAAFVVKEYLLPMFESDGKRLLAVKR